jgi:hypothetical protein
VLKAVPEWIQTYEKTGGFKLPPRETTAAPLRKSWVVLTYRRTKTILLQRCENRGRL